MKILIVDDSKTILKLNGRIVSKVLPASEIVVFDVPAKAVEATKNGKFIYDFAFIDYNMEGLNGVELAQALVALSPAPLVYKNICIVSANVQESVMTKARELGMIFMAKPLDEEKLKSFLKDKGV